MRLRHVKNAKEIIETNSHIVILNPTEYKGKWNSLFGNDNPIHIEIGMGKGQFIHKMALLNPNINYIGIEKFDSVICRAIEKLVEDKPANLYLLREDAGRLLEFFENGEISRIYLNFSDPWPKAKHEKRRLTFKSFLEMYEQILVSKGAVYFKTDNKPLFDYSLESIENYGLELKNISYDLANSGMADNVLTEFEEKHMAMGEPIYRLEAYKVK